MSNETTPCRSTGQAPYRCPGQAPYRCPGQAYRCQRCDQQIGFERGEWGCACWAVSAEEMTQGGAALPPAWRPVAAGEGEP